MDGVDFDERVSACVWVSVFSRRMRNLVHIIHTVVLKFECVPSCLYSLWSGGLCVFTCVFVSRARAQQLCVICMYL